MQDVVFVELTLVSPMVGEMISLSMLARNINEEMAKASSSSMSVTSFLQPNKPLNVTEAEARWALFVAEHNLASDTSEHSTKLLPI